MKQDALQGAEKYTKAHQRRKRWYQVVTGLACVVVFCTVYALILPAITMEKGACEIPEHTHSEACYTQVTAATRTEPVCTIESLNLHQHDDTCYDSEGNLTCGYADFVVHQHDSACYDENGNLWCPLPEIETHAHTESCYAVPETDAPEVHTHTDDCYTVERGELICTESTEPAHVHTDDCYTETSALVCEEDHEHTESCYETTRELTCGYTEEPAHQHTDQCYEQIKTLICDLPTEPAEEAEPAEPELICDKTEVILHEHTSDCFDDGNLICDKIQVLEHQHTDACFTTVEEPADTETLTCTLPEDENHTHDSLCYGIWELTCAMEEHTHSEVCSAQEEELNPEKSTAPEESTVPEEPLDTEMDSDLPVMGTASTSASVFASPKMSTFALTRQTETDPLDVKDYVSNAVLYYRTSENPTWQDVTSAENIPGDADFKLVINYKEVPIDRLQAAARKMTFTLPGLLRNTSVNGKIISGTEEAGTIVVSGSTVTLTFDETWLNRQQANNSTVIAGDFYVEAKANLSGVDDNPQIVIGDVTIGIDFEDDVIAKHGDVDLSKTVSPVVSEEENGDFLTYTLTVTAGEDGCPAVTVVDRFTSNIASIQEYVGVTGVKTNTNNVDAPTETGGTGSVYIGAAPTTETPIPAPAGADPAKPGTLVWVIGDMAARETRTLTYRAKLAETYAGHISNEIKNTADIYSETYNRGRVTTTFTPVQAVSMSKMVSTFVKDENGGGTLTYTVWVKANEGNSYVMKDVTISGTLDGSFGSTPTSEGIREHLYYDETTFALYGGGIQNQNGNDGLTLINEALTPEFTGQNTAGKNNGHFKLIIGSLKPGERRTLTYTVKVEPGVYVAAGNETIPIYSCDRVLDCNNRVFNTVHCNKTLDRKVWSRKLVGDPLEAETTVSMAGNAYDATGDSVISMTNPGSFTTPAGSYRYQVVANEAGDWDLSATSFKDTLGSNYLQFVGFVRLDAYTISEDNPVSGSTDEARIENLKNRTPAATVWIKVDDKSAFNIKPSEVGLTETYAYLLTYYAKPVNTAGIAQVVVPNDFELKDNAGIGNFMYTVIDIKTSASVTVQGDNSFSAEKYGWYYEEPKVTEGDFKNGALYWAIKVDGNKLLSGTQIRDSLDGYNGKFHYFKNNSLVGVFTGSLENHLKSYADIYALQGSGRLRSLSTGAYTSVIATGSCSMTVTLNEDVDLAAEESLYIILKSEPDPLPENKRDMYIYLNKLQTSSDGGNTWVECNTASLGVAGRKFIIKEYGKTFTYDGTTVKDVTVGSNGNPVIVTNKLCGEGTYVAWTIRVNHFGNLEGTYRVIDTIPEGMELAYVRTKWLGINVRLAPDKPCSVQITDLGGDWAENIITANDDNSQPRTDYYYTNGNQVCWDVKNLQVKNEKDNYSICFQVVCRVTDPDVLLGGIEKSFNNRVTLYKPDGTEVGNDSDGVSVKIEILSKQGTYVSEINAGRYPFKITLNELGEDLVSGSDTITLVDELSDTLNLDASSIKVVDTRTNEEVNGWTASVAGQTLKIVLPDSRPLTVTYEATVSAMPGQAVNISNNAHWEDYTTPDSGSVDVEDFTYQVGGTVGADSTPSITVMKLDQYNTSKRLSGAAFKLEKGTYSEGGFTPDKNFVALTGTTSEDGTLTFGRRIEERLEYNTVYCLTETTAPEGYVLDSTPHYFAVAKQQEDGSYPTFPNGVTVWYQSADYTYQTYNHKGEATVAKAFLDAGGNHLAKIDGAYRFGIYTEANPTGDPLQTVTITYANSSVTPAGGTARFTNLTLGGTYYIYELDDSGQPISGNVPATVNSSSFLVTYTNGPAVTVPADGSAAATVTVTNQVCYPELPNTGGAGTVPYTMGGSLLLTGAAFLLLYHHTKRRKEDFASS